MADNNSFGLGIDIDETTAQGQYSNLVIISHSPSEFILDFATVLPNVEKARIKSRIILTPEHAKWLLRSLEDNIRRYETTVGKIDLHQPAEAGPKIGEA